LIIYSISGNFADEHGFRSKRRASKKSEIKLNERKISVLKLK